MKFQVLKKLYQVLILSTFLPSVQLLADTGGSCKDLILVMHDEKAPQDKKKDLLLFLDCHGANAHFPEATTMNFFRYINGELCHGHRVCGNVKGWTVSGKVGVRYYFGNANFGNISNDSGNNSNSSNTTIPLWAAFVSGGNGGFGNGNIGNSNVYGEISTNYENFKHYCTEMQEWECTHIPI